MISKRARLRALRMLLGEQSKPGRTPPELDQLREDLVAAGWVHWRYVEDPVHHDKAGRYLYWGM